MELREHLGNAARARWAKQTKEQRAEHARMMNEKRWRKPTNQQTSSGVQQVKIV